MDRGDKTARWVILGCASLVALFLYVLMQCVSPLLPVLITDFKLSHSLGGFLYSIPILMIAVFSYPLGIVSDRIGMESAVGFGFSLAVFCSLIRVLSPNFLSLALFTALFGIGFSLCFPNLPKLVKENFPQHLAGTATGVYTAAIPLGSGLGIALTKPVLAVVGGWREVVVAWSLMALPVAVLWWAAARPTRRRRNQSRFSSSEKSGPLWSESPNRRPLLASVLIAGAILSLLNLIFYCTIGWLPTYLMERGWNPSLAATATSVISFVEIPAVLLYPVLSDYTGKRRFIMILSFILITCCSGTVSLFPSLSWFVSPIFGMTFGGIFALLLALPVELVERGKVGRAAGAIISTGYVGALLGPPIAGYVRDATGDFAFGFLAMAAAGLVAAVLSRLLPENKTTPTRTKRTRTAATTGSMV